MRLGLLTRGPAVASLRPDRRTPVRVGVAWLAVASLASACGARTALLVPCEIQLQGTQSAAVWILDHDDGYTGLGAVHLADGATVADVEQSTLAAILPPLDDAVLMGAILYPDNSMMVGMPLTGCLARTSLGVPIGAHHAAAIMAYEAPIELPNGGAAIENTLSVVAPPLLATVSQGIPSYAIVLLSDDTGCDTPTQTAATLAALAAQGIKTLIWTIDTPDWLFGPEIDDQNLLAVAGGLPRPDGSERFYDVSDLAALQAGLAQVFLVPYYCQLHTASTLPGDPNAVVLNTGSGWSPPRDTTRQDGWDWTDVSAGQLEIFGPSCDRMIAGQLTATLFTLANLCEL